MVLHLKIIFYYHEEHVIKTFVTVKKKQKTGFLPYKCKLMFYFQNVFGANKMAKQSNVFGQNK